MNETKTKAREENPIINVVLIIELKNKEGKRDLESERLERIIKAYSKYYVMIEHDKDQEEDGTYKRPHEHIIMELKHRQRPLTLIKKLSEDLNIKVERISIRPMRNKQLATQYMLHLNNPEKTNYNITELITNDIEQMYEDLTDTNENERLTAAKLINIIKKETSKVKILRIIGLKNYNRYIRVIDMLLEEKNFDYEFKKEFLECVPTSKKD